MITLAFDTATATATVAVAQEDDVVAERRSTPVRVLREIDDALAEVGAERGDIDRLVVGTGPGSYTSLRMGLMTARTLAFALGVPAAGVSTLAALAAGTPGAVPILDARRGEVFTLVGGEPRVLAPEDLDVVSGGTYVGDGAVRYRAVIEAKGGTVPADDDAHVPLARHHIRLAHAFGDAERLEPLYLRVPDAELALREGRLRV
ncbi:MAG: tRNA (adenosine(37)-N6)-threonylcarbamoyltransferase complex dimerization subunit type 1 TsaB [Actinomycetota bacterium]|nr:tRNA (adenosine(37)-N6)-threonylcarbamoyltransferase complex dimerization subunit type 1 TsaB [Actinomycetota bacterium]